MYAVCKLFRFTHFATHKILYNHCCTLLVLLLYFLLITSLYDVLQTLKGTDTLSLHKGAITISKQLFTYSTELEQH